MPRTVADSSPRADGGPKEPPSVIQSTGHPFQAASSASGLPKRIDHFDGYGIRRLRFPAGTGVAGCCDATGSDKSGPRFRRAIAIDWKLSRRIAAMTMMTITTRCYNNTDKLSNHFLVSRLISRPRVLSRCPQDRCWRKIRCPLQCRIAADVGPELGFRQLRERAMSR